MPELWTLGAAALVAGYRRGEFTPVDAAQACLARVGATQPSLNAFVHVDQQATLEAAQASARRWASSQPLGPLDGVPVSLKDNLHARGWPTTWGSRDFAGFVAPNDEEPVARLRAGGAVFLGKTNLPEFAMQGVTSNELQGTTRNPWNPALTPGGSSGGAAAAVAAGCGPLALVTDGGGSARRPASHCGVLGFKAGEGAVPRGRGLPEIFLGFEVPGLIARHAGDAAAAFHALTTAPAPPAALRPLRILHVARFADHPVDAGIEARVHEAAEALRSLGHSVAAAPRLDLAEAVNAGWSTLSGTGLAWLAAQPVDGRRLDPSSWTAASREALQRGRDAPATELFELMAHVQSLRSVVRTLFADRDLLLTPATAALPWPVEQSHPAMIDGRPVGPRGHAVFTAFANAAGLPAVALPAGSVAGLPTGFQLVGPPGSDALLLALAAQWEAARPWPMLAPLVP